MSDPERAAAARPRGRVPPGASGRGVNKDAERQKYLSMAGIPAN
ncbi:hypothetical protein [Sorangium sp. So ce388]